MQSQIGQKSVLGRDSRGGHRGVHATVRPRPVEARLVLEQSRDVFLRVTSIESHARARVFYGFE